MNPISWIEARIWQVGTVAAGAAAIGFAGALVVANVQKGRLSDEVERLNGRVATLDRDLRTCRRNARDLELTINDQNDKIAAQAEAGKRATAAAAAALARVEQENRRLGVRVAVLLAAPADAEDQCERVRQVDRAVQEAFR